jgi:hypothetical protein
VIGPLRTAFGICSFSFHFFIIRPSFQFSVCITYEYFKNYDPTLAFLRCSQVSLYSSRRGLLLVEDVTEGSMEEEIEISLVKIRSKVLSKVLVFLQILLARYYNRDTAMYDVSVQGQLCLLQLFHSQRIALHCHELLATSFYHGVTRRNNTVCCAGWLHECKWKQEEKRNPEKSQRCSIPCQFGHSLKRRCPGTPQDKSSK